VLQHVVLKVMHEGRSVLSVVLSNLCGELGGSKVNLDLNLIALIVRVHELCLTNEDLLTLLLGEVEERHPGLSDNLFSVLTANLGNSLAFIIVAVEDLNLIVNADT